MDEFQQLKQQVSRIQLELNGVLGIVQGDQQPKLASPDSSFHPLPIVTPPSAVNQTRNGEFSHSQDTWTNPPPGSPTSDEGKECFGWYSNLAPFAGQVLDFTNSPASSVNQALKAFVDDGGVHSTYNPAFCDWDRDNGEARLQGTTTLDALMPNNRQFTPNRAVEYFGALIAKRNSTIVVPDDLKIFVGLWDNTTGVDRPNWIVGVEFGLVGEVRGTPVSTTERRYRIYAFTDRGYQYLSIELTVLDAPSDDDFDIADVYLTWDAIPGILQYAVYRHDVVAGKFRLLRQSLISNTYADNGSVLLDDVGGYPSATNTIPIAYVATRSHDLDNVPVDGFPWAVLTLNPAIPQDYDLSTTTAEQVLRIGMTEALDRRLTDVGTFAGDNTVTSLTGDFTTLDVARTVTLTKDDHTLETTIASINSATSVELTDAPDWESTDATLYIDEGGDHGILVDAVHISYVPSSAFAPYPDDLNRLQNGGQDPIAAPNHSSQGGAGGGGSIDPGEGGIGCVALDTPISVIIGDKIESLIWSAVNVGESLFSGNLRPNRVLRKMKAHTDSLHLVRVRLSWLHEIELLASPMHPLITNYLDDKGRAVVHLRKGDSVLVSVDGHTERRAITEIIDTGIAAEVGTFYLWPFHCYAAGNLRYRSRLRKFIGRFFKTPVVGLISHNLKPDEQRQA